MSCPLFTESLVQVLSDNAKKITYVRTTRVVDNDAEFARVLVNHSPKHEGTLRLLVCQARQLVLKGLLGPCHSSGG
jgi:hypothetical protein